jgi:cell division protein FtsI (penicillin-binding protein 3)
MEGFGASAAGPVFKAVIAEALRILDVPKDLPDNPPANTQIAQNQKDQSLDDVSIADLGSGQPNILEDSDDDEPAAPRTQAFVGPTAPPAPAPVAGTVPNFKGMTLRAVLREAEAKGLPVQPDGSGVARIQNPPPGAVLHQGERIRVQFTR